MSKAFAALAVLLGLGGLSLFSVGPKPHSHTIEVTYDGSKYMATKDTIEIDFGYTTTFTVQNRVNKDLRFVLDAGPTGKCRVDFTPNHATKCETDEIPLPANGTATFTATAKAMDWDCDLVCMVKGDCNYSCPLVVTARPRFASDIKIGETTGGLNRVDPELEIERDPPPLIGWLVILGSILSALASWWARRRT